TAAEASEEAAPAEPEPAAMAEVDEEPINVLERELKPGEVPLDELDRIFAETESDFDAAAAGDPDAESYRGGHGDRRKNISR
ncbi:MAG: hypothetical protein AAGA01_15530, partial [Cyanobacteria bacterium P01_E01_bin.43]